MAATIWGEARSEPLAGRIAVGWVVRNRAADPGWWGRDVRTCCLSPGQFSCWWDTPGPGGAPGRRDATRPFRACLQIAGEVMTGDLADPTGGADHYHRDDVRPALGAGRKPIRVIGRHIFYRLGAARRGRPSPPVRPGCRRCCFCRSVSGSIWKRQSRGTLGKFRH